jgi:hypothetical protein
MCRCCATSLVLQPVLTLIEGRPVGLLLCLDDEAFLGVKGSEDGFMTNVSSHGSHSAPPLGCPLTE